jgi:hypothetical protein
MHQSSRRDESHFPNLLVFVEDEMGSVIWIFHPFSIVRGLNGTNQETRLGHFTPTENWKMGKMGAGKEGLIR